MGSIISIIIDEGLLWLLNQLKAQGDIPADVTFKVSIYAGHASAAVPRGATTR